MYMYIKYFVMGLMEVLFSCLSTALHCAQSKNFYSFSGNITTFNFLSAALDFECYKSVFTSSIVEYINFFIFMHLITASFFLSALVIIQKQSCHQRFVFHNKVHVKKFKATYYFFKKI